MEISDVKKMENLENELEKAIIEDKKGLYLPDLTILDLDFICKLPEETQERLLSYNPISKHGVSIIDFYILVCGFAYDVGSEYNIVEYGQFCSLSKSFTNIKNTFKGFEGRYANISQYCEQYMWIKGWIDKFEWLKEKYYNEDEKKAVKASLKACQS